MFKKIYVEITNICNLNCSFCVKNNRKKEYISIENFKILLEKLKGHTKYLYFHIMGEPTIHPHINELIDIASEHFNINITTNGTMLERISDNKNIRQVNISIHSINDNLENHLNYIFKHTEKMLKNNTIVNYRLWVKGPQYNKIIQIINNYYNVNILEVNKKTIKKNLYVDYPNEFEWPSLKSEAKYSGGCRGTIDHLGILVDGTVVPCCLDSEGVINLGNMYKNELEEIINSDKLIQIKEGFKQNKRIHPLCKNCNFYTNKKITTLK